MTLLFVYNANSGTLNTLFDIGHKLLRPKTYACRLCALTFDMFSENDLWKTFRKESGIPMEFYHKDEFESVFPNVKVKFPAVLKLEDSSISIVLNDEVIDGLTTVDALITRLKTSL